MELVAHGVRDSRLWITCAGEYGVGSRGNPSGQRVKAVIEQALARENGSLVEVVIDFRQVRYEWGDGPAWSVLPALRAGLRVRYLASEENQGALGALMAFSGFTKWLVVETGGAPEELRPECVRAGAHPAGGDGSTPAGDP